MGTRSFIVFFALALFAFTQSAFAHTIDTPTQVTITEHGYSPESLSIHVGTTIEWINDDTVPHWPASDFHPTHTAYPEFDPHKALMPGERWSFTFDKTGYWRWHDHTHPTTGGTITVHDDGTDSKTRSAVYAPNIQDVPIFLKTLAYMRRAVPSALIAQLSETEQYQLLEYIAYEISPEAALQYLNTRLSESAYFTNAQMHSFVHIVGHALYDMRGLEGVGVCVDTPQAIGEPCYHGILEKYLAEQGDLDTFDADVFLELCSGEIYTTFCGAIHHGVGHGFASFYSLDLPKSLKKCGSLETRRLALDCMRGVFMEWSKSVPFATLEDYRAAPWLLCTELEQPLFQDACAFEMPRIISYQEESKQEVGFNLHEHNAAIAKTCATAPYSRLRKACYRGAGRMSAIRISAGNTPITFCEAMTPGTNDDKRDCLVAAAKRLAALTSQETAEQYRAVCDHLLANYREPSRQMTNVCARLPQ